MADRLDYFFRQRVTEAELDLGFELLEKADRNLAADIGLFGVITGAEPAPHAPVPDLTIDLTAPTRAYDELGQRIFFGTAQTVNCAADYAGIPTEVPLPGQERWLGVFLKFDRLLSEPRTDGNSQDVYFRRDESFAFVVRQGPPAAVGAATKVPLVAGELLLCDVRRQNGQIQIQSGDIDVSRRQAFIFAQADSVEIVSGLWDVLDPAVNTVQSALDEVDAELDAHFGGTARRHPASAIDYAPHGFVSSTDVQAAIDELINDLSSPSGAGPGASRIGADAVPGTPHTLPAGNVDGQLSQLLGWLNSHESAAAGAHNASAIAAASHAYIGGTSVQAQLQEIVGDLQSQSATLGAAQVGDAAISGSPNSLAAGTVREHLSALLGGINDHINDASGAHAASAVSYAGASGSASNSAPTYSAPANPVEDALDFLLAEVNKRVAKAGDSIAGTLDLGSGRVATGLDVGFQTGTPLADQLRVGDTNFFLHWDGTDPRLNFDSGSDRLLYDRSANAYLFQIGGTTEMQLAAAGLSIANGLYVGSDTGTPTDNNIYAQGSIEAGAFVRANTYVRGNELYLVPQASGTATAGYVRTHSIGNRMSVFDGTTWLGAVALKYAAINDPPQEIASNGGYANFPDQVVIPGGTLRPGTVVRVNASFRLRTYNYSGSNTPSGTFRWYINAKGPGWSSQIINTGSQQRWWYIEGTIEAEFTVYQSSTWDTITNLKAVARRNNGGYSGSYDCAVLHTAGWDWGFSKSDQNITLYASIYDSGTGDVCQLLTFTVEILEAAN